MDTSDASALQVSTSSTPFLRAGYANGLWIVGPAVAFLLWSVLEPHSLVAGVVAAGMAISALLAAYCCAVSSVAFDKEVVLTLPVGHVKISRDEILKVDLREHRSFAAVTLFVTLKSSRVPRFFFFVSPATSWGSLSQTVERLRDQLRAVPLQVAGQSRTMS